MYNGDRVLKMEEKETLEEEEVGREEIIKAIKSLRNNKAGGPDQIPIELIKNGNDSLQEKVIRIVKRTFETGRLNQDFVNGEIITIPKKENTMKCEEHRTIALTSHVMKIFLKEISNRIKTVLNRKISPFQYGFMPNRGHLDAITALKTIASIKIEQRKVLFEAFVDFEKAFDRVYHQKLMEILESEKIGNKSLRVIKNLYATQTAQMRMEPTTKISITRGVR